MTHLNTNAAPLRDFTVVQNPDAHCAFHIEGDGRQICELDSNYERTINRSLELVRTLARMSTPEDDFAALVESEGDDCRYDDIDEMVADMDDERLCGEYGAFMDMVRAAREVVGDQPEPEHGNTVLDALTKAESFISGFEGDELQEGIDALLADLRSAISVVEGR